MNKYASRLALKDGLNKIDVPKDMFKYIKDFSVVCLTKGSKINLETKDNEMGIVIFVGRCDIAIDGHLYKDLGIRPNVFNGMPTGVYVPINSDCQIISHGVEMGVCLSKCSKKTDIKIIRPEDIRVIQVGRDNYKREVRIIIGPTSPSVNLIIGETINPSGNWSGTPAHKHEKVNPPSESLHEELYYFKTDKPQGFGIERLYSYEKGINELIHLEDNTVTFMPYGYHQIVAGPGYSLYYLFFLSGAGKDLIGFTDPGHNWINQ